MMSSFVKFLRPLMVTLLVMGSSLLIAQSTTDGAIGGTVYDSHGAVVANAKITVRNNGTNAEKAATTNDSGYFRVTASAASEPIPSISRSRALLPTKPKK